MECVILGCKECAMSKSPHHLPSGKLLPLPNPHWPWSQLAVDFITNLPPLDDYTCITLDWKEYRPEARSWVSRGWHLGSNPVHSSNTSHPQSPARSQGQSRYSTMASESSALSSRPWRGVLSWWYQCPPSHTLHQPQYEHTLLNHVSSLQCGLPTPYLIYLPILHTWKCLPWIPIYTTEICSYF